MTKVYFDFETRSAADLKKVGAHKYSMHPTTDIICVAWAVNDGPVKIYRHIDGDDPSVLKELFFYVTNTYFQFTAHNAQFEKVIWENVCVRKYGWPPLNVQRLDCTMVRAYSMGLMGSLEQAGNCVGLDVEKDMAGNRVMLQLAKPRSVCKKTGKITWWRREDSKPKLDINEKYDRTYEYCMQDITVLRELDRRLVPMDPFEKQTWIIDQAINDRGVHIDIAAAKNFIAMAEYEQHELNIKMRKLTNQYVSSCNAHIALKTWVNNNHKIKDEEGNPVVFESMDKASLKDLLEMKLPKNVREVLLTRQAAAKSSVNKLNRMIDSADHRNRSQGCFQFNGAPSTGRWAGRRIQLQNMPRPMIKQTAIEEVMERVASI